MELWDHDRYLARRKVLALLGAQFHIYDPMGNVIAFVKQKAFKLKEDIRVYSDESMTRELLLIRARSMLDFSAAYDVNESESGKKLGALRRKGFSSMLRDSWEILDPTDEPIGRISEDSMGMALLRRFLSNLIPQRYQFRMYDQTVGTIRQLFNPFVHKFEVDFSSDINRMLPRELGLAAVILLLAIEGRQD